MKIKLNRDLWNHKIGDIIESSEDRGTWAIRKGYAEQVLEPIKPKKAKVQNKMIDPKYKKNAN